MKIVGSISAAQVSGIARTLSGLAGAGAGASSSIQLWAARGAIVRTFLSQFAYPTPREGSPPDTLFWSDRTAYLRAAVAAHDWDAIAKYYATWIQEKTKVDLYATNYWDVASLDLTTYLPSGDTWTWGDVRAFFDIVQKSFLVHDLGSNVGFGLRAPLYDETGDFGTDLGRLVQTTTLQTVMNLTSVVQGANITSKKAVPISAPASPGRISLSVGWHKEASKSKQIINQVVATVVVAAVTFGFAIAAAPAAGAAGGATGGATGGGTGGAVGGATAGGVASGIEVVTVTATVPTISAGSVGAGLAAGGIVAVATPPPISSVQAPPIETVTVTAAPIAAPPISAVGAGAVAGALVPIATAPPAIYQPPSTIETVTVEGTRPPTSVQVPPEVASIIGSNVIQLTNPGEPNVSEPRLNEVDGDTLQDRLLEQLQEAGAGYVSDWIAGWLAEQLGRPPTQEEIDEWTEWAEQHPTGERTPVEQLLHWLPYIVLGATLGYAAYEYSKSPNKTRRKIGAK